jgi:hypothetical protein
MMLFCNGTHSKGDPPHCTLDFYTKVQVWGRKFHPHKRSSWAKNEMMSALPCQKREKIYKEKKERNKGEKEHSALLDLCYH